jgi:hypothetical protein
MKICGLASGECGISIPWLGTGLGGPKGSRFHTDPSLLNRARYRDRLPSAGNDLRSKSRTSTSTIEESTSSLTLTLALTLPYRPGRT